MRLLFRRVKRFLCPPLIILDIEGRAQQMMCWRINWVTQQWWEQRGEQLVNSIFQDSPVYRRLSRLSK